MQEFTLLWMPELARMRRRASLLRRAPRAVRGGAPCACAVRGRSPAERRTHSQCARTAAWARAHKVRVYIRIHSCKRVRAGARAWAGRALLDPGCEGAVRDFDGSNESRVRGFEGFESFESFR